MTNPPVSMRALVNRWRRRIWRLLFARMLFGERSQGQLRPATRLSPTVLIEHEDRLALADDVFVGHFVFIEASAGVRIGTGVQIANFVSIVSHSTHRSVRVAKALSGMDLPAGSHALPGDQRAGIAVGAHSFIGPHSTLEAGTQLGVGCLVASHCRVRGEVPDFAIVAGNPAQVVGDVRQGDARWLANLAAQHGLDGADLVQHYDRWCAQVAHANRTASPQGWPAGEGRA